MEGRFWIFIVLNSIFCLNGQINSSKLKEKECYVSGSIAFNCGLASNVSFISHGQLCIYQLNTSHEIEFKCNNGQWIKEIQVSSPYAREKRQADSFISKGMSTGAGLGGLIGGPLGGAIGSAAGFIVGGIFCIFLCHDKDPGPPPNQPPTIDCKSFPIKNQYTAPPNGTSLMVDFGHFEGSDNEDGKIIAVSIPESPAMLHRGSNLIMFTVTDSNRYQQSCALNIEVKVVTCNQPPWPKHGFVHCESGEVLLGRTCTVVCQHGYELTGNPILKCVDENKFHASPPTCSLIHCTNTSKIQPQHGHAYCDNSTFPFGTVCVSDCDEGYGTNSIMFSRCKEERSWSIALPPCKDKEPPSFTNCPPTKHVYADKGKDMATVSWVIPNASDNSGLKPIVIQKKGQPAGSLFGGFTEISYIAKDDSGNVSPACTFFIFVEKQFCSPPVFNGDIYLYYTCGKSGYQYGSECTIGCKGSYPLVGNDKMVCDRNATSDELFWDWGSQEKPYCKQNKCPALKAPTNGALACDKWMYGTQCAMQCNNKFDIPIGVGGSSTFTGRFTCSTVSGKWSPLQQVPNCTALRVGRNHRIPGELVYSGNCNDEVTKKQIQQNFVNLMQKLESQPGYKGVCPNKETCKVDNVEVICGSRRKRRRSDRASNDVITLTFEFVRTYEPFGNSTISAMQHAKTKFAVLQKLTSEFIQQGLMDVPKANIDKSSLQYGEVDIDCGPGRFPKYSSLTCAACASGSYLEENTGKCINCHKGSFKDDEDAINCTRCPTGMTTEGNGSVSSSECKEICTPGFFSTNGLEPCSPCHRGTYSTTQEATACKTCPDNKYSMQSGSTKIGDCFNYDLRLKSASAIVNLRPTSSSLKTISISLWIRRKSTNSMIEIRIGDNNDLILNISSEIQFSYSSQKVATGIFVNHTNWNHIGLVIDAASNMHTYVGGKKRFSKVIVARSITTHKASIREHSGFDVSGLVVSEKPFTAHEIQQQSITCDNVISDALLTSNDLREIISSSIEMIIPSVCDAVDECTTNPCNGHICKNELLGFKCKCNDGYTGSSCEIPPDFCKDNSCENGATCHNNVANYTCVCPSRLQGLYCEVAPVDGQWSQWSEWLHCDASCGGGKEIRYRNCTNPAPGDHGYPCSGSSIESKACNSFTCPTCPHRPSAYGVRMHCKTEKDVTSCTATCREGLTFVPGYPALKEYECGQKTNYTWNGHPPSCSRLNSPSKIEIHSAISYTKFPCNDVHHAKSQIYRNAKSGLQCGKNDTCEIQIDIKGCGSREKRSTDVEAVITLTISLDQGDNLDLDKYMSNKTISPALVNVIKAIAELENSALEINRTGQVFQIPGVKIDIGQVQVTSDIICSPGKIRIAAFCVDCPAGTFENSNAMCEPCNFGMYQNLLGQTLCKSCSDGYTTAIVGAQDISLCTVSKVKEIGTNFEGKSGSKGWIVAVAVVVPIVLVLMLVGGLLVRKQIRIKYRKQTMGSSFSFNMVNTYRQDAGKPMNFVQRPQF